MFGIFSTGNYGKNNTVIQPSESSQLNGKTIFFLGSSVTYGYGSLGTSFVDFLVSSDGIIAVKEAVSGTTLADLKDNSYVSRLKNFSTSVSPDAFVCQLSTNDATKNIPLGNVSDNTDIKAFDTKTVAGAIEYITAYVKINYDCPVIFYTQARYDSENYAKMVDLLYEIQAKWNFEILDLWNNASFNNISPEKRKLYLIDNIHPSKAGYKDWWLPEFQQILYKTVR